MASFDHDRLKRLARVILEHRGFKDSEIFVEYRVPSIKKDLVVDVVGIQTEESGRTTSVAIECGNTPAEKIPQLKLFFDEVIILPYIKGLTDSALQDMETKLQSLIRANKEQYDKLEDFYQRVVNRVTELKGINRENTETLEDFKKALDDISSKNTYKMVYEKKMGEELEKLNETLLLQQEAKEEGLDAEV